MSRLAEEQMQEEIEQLKTQNKAMSEVVDAAKREKHILWTALNSLVDLKRYKDEYGKDGVYMTRQPVVWSNAKQALAIYKQTIEG